jgi:hypothetical protein
MDVRDWKFLEKQLDELGSISQELAQSGFAEKIAYTAFFWTLLSYYESADERAFKAGAMSLPDHLTPNNRQKIETMCGALDQWLCAQDPASHPRSADLARVVHLGLQATTHPLFDPGHRTP